MSSPMSIHSLEGHAVAVPRDRRATDPPTAATPLLTVIVPVYNEAATIAQLLGRVAQEHRANQVIVVDDGSEDGTAAVLRTWSGEPGFEIVSHATNRGKGMAVRTGLSRARGRFVVIQDADLEYDPADYRHLVEPLQSGRADAVYGSRYLAPHVASHRDWGVCRFGVCLLNCWARWIYGIRLTDQATCYKVFPTAALRAMDLRCERFEFCSEVTAKACRMGLRILEVPVSYSPRTRREGKKIRWRDGVAALRSLWRWRQWECIDRAGTNWEAIR